jgi:hypothetical protein
MPENEPYAGKHGLKKLGSERGCRGGEHDMQGGGEVSKHTAWFANSNLML